MNRWWHRVRGKEDPYLKIGEVNDRTKPVSGSKKRNLTTEDTTERLGRSEEEQTKFGPKGEGVGTTESKSTEVGAGGNQRADSGEFLEGHSQAGLQMDSESVKFDSLDPSRLAPAGLPSAVSRAAAQPPGCGKNSPTALAALAHPESPSTS